MAWTTPPTFSANDVLTSTNQQKLSDDLNETAPAKAAAKGDLFAATAANAIAAVTVGTNYSHLIADSAASAGVAWVLPQIARAVRSSNQSINSASDIAVQFDAADTFDTNSLHDPSSNNTRLTASVAGYYMVEGTITFASDTAGTYNYVRIRKGGSTIYATQRDAQAAATGVTPQLNVCAVVDLAANDYVELMVGHDKGSAKNLTAASFSMFLIARK